MLTAFEVLEERELASNTSIELSELTKPLNQCLERLRTNEQ